MQGSRQPACPKWLTCLSSSARRYRVWFAGCVLTADSGPRYGGAHTHGGFLCNRVPRSGLYLETQFMDLYGNENDVSYLRDHGR